MQKNESSAKSSAKEIVREYLQALVERRDFQSARSYITDNLSYTRLLLILLIELNHT
jgi:hypothetical protein